MKIGGPPEEIEIAFAMVSCVPLEAAHVCRSDIEGKWISAILWNGAGPPCTELNTFVATDLGLARQLSNGHGHVLIKIETLRTSQDRSGQNK